MEIQRDRGMARMLALVIAIVALGIALFFVAMAMRVAINPEAWICALGLVPIALGALVIAMRREQIEIDPGEVRLVHTTLGRRSVQRLAPITTVRVDALGPEARVAVVDGSGVVHVLFRGVDAAARAGEIAARLGVPIDRR